VGLRVTAEDWKRPVTCAVSERQSHKKSGASQRSFVCAGNRPIADPGPAIFDAGKRTVEQDTRANSGRSTEQAVGKTLGAKHAGLSQVHRLTGAIRIRQQSGRVQQVACDIEIELRFRSTWPI
jgi:hypothetical protein